MTNGDRGTLGHYLQALRQEAGLTLRQLAERCGVSNPYLSQLEQGQGKCPSPTVLWALADCYQVDWFALMRLAGHAVPPVPDQATNSTIMLRGVERLTPNEREEIEEIIALKLRRRQEPKKSSRRASV